MYFLIILSHVIKFQIQQLKCQLREATILDLRINILTPEVTAGGRVATAVGRLPTIVAPIIKTNT